VIVSAHSYWIGTEEERKGHYRYIIDKVTGENIAFILGEGPTPSGYDCTASPYEWAMDELQRAEIGWLAWSWGLAPNGDCKEANRYDMTDGGVFGRWKSEFGERIAVSHPASIRNTSRRPCSIPNAGSNCVRAAGARGTRRAR
jgi:mannan endo-1,4-beta-mannosidase